MKRRYEEARFGSLRALVVALGGVLIRIFLDSRAALAGITKKASDKSL